MIYIPDLFQSNQAMVSGTALNLCYSCLCVCDTQRFFGLKMNMLKSNKFVLVSSITKKLPYNTFILSEAVEVLDMI